MNVLFSARFTPVVKVNRPSGVTKGQYDKVLDRFQNDWFLQDTFQETSDDIEVAIQRETDESNQILMRINRDPESLPSHLQKYAQKPQQIFAFDPAFLMMDYQAAALQLQLLKVVKATSNALSQHDAQRLELARSGFAGVPGMDQLKQELYREVIQPIQSPQMSDGYGNVTPNGVMLFGPPGCGKTFIAEHLAQELKVPFFKVSMSDMFSSYIHATAKSLEAAVQNAVKHAPSLLFIDEVDAVGQDRGGLGGHQSHKLEEVSALLNNTNKLADKGVILVVATNRPELLDPAIKRTGRLDKHVYVGLPDEKAREEALKYHMQGRTKVGEVDYPALAKRLEGGYTFADIEYIVKQAAGYASNRRELITTEAFEAVLKTVPPSTPPAVEAKYQTATTRGTQSSFEAAPKKRSIGESFLPPTKDKDN